jgi:hypothetical protein
MREGVIEHKPLDQLEREDIARQALEAAARRLEERAGNSVYMKAWKIGARLIRAMKPG